jgi:glucose-6-phosphate 1-dehydrogenase
MQKIRLSVSEQEILCAEIEAPPIGLVIFGASGDLTRGKLLPSLFRLFERGLLNERFYLLGCGRNKLSDDRFRQTAQQAIKASAGNFSVKETEPFVKHLYYASGGYEREDFYEDIKKRLSELDKKHGVKDNRIFYLAVPPFLYATIVEHLGSSKLSRIGSPALKQQAKLAVEKPFGRDLQSAIELNNEIHRCFDEPQIYRIDHYLGKETVQNILMFRFANTIFEPVWNRNYIDHVQITIAESVGVEHRASYYDKAGALRDMFQNHMLGMLSLVAMEPPASFDADHIRDEKVKLLHSIRPFKLLPWQTNIIRGRYTAGIIGGRNVCGFKQEQGIAPDSKTETFVAAKMFVDNWRWKDVPFYLRTGKRLSRKLTEIVIIFKKVPHSMFASVGLDDMPANVLVLKIQPEEGIQLSFQAKRPGSKTCVGTLTMDFNYSEIFGIGLPEAHQRLLLDCMIGDQTLFTRQDDVEVTWKLLMPVLKAWESDDSLPQEYTAGTDNFPEADGLIEADGRKWRSLSGS